MKTGVIALTLEQHRRLEVINKANDGFLTVREAAEQVGVSERQMQRLKKEVRENGPAALIHKNSNRTPINAIPLAKKEEILKIRNKAGYNASNFAHFRELLETQHGIYISYSALRRLLKEAGIASPKKRRRFKQHRRRKRREQAGSLTQMDASPYDWLGLGMDFALHGAIDDATGQVLGLYLCQNECQLGYFEITRRMIGNYGIPEAVYADRHTIFRSPNEDKAKAIDAPAGMKVNETQFGRAMSELGIRIIAARSPQAKGRIERLWGTLQSRLPVELAIRGIKDVHDANEFLQTYIFAYNSEFAIEPQDNDTAFLPLEQGRILDHILCVKEQRVLDNGQVFSYRGKRFQIEKTRYSDYIPPKAKVSILVSPYIGIKASYRSYVFDTKPAPAKAAKTLKSLPIKNKKHDPGVYRSDSPFVGKGGLPWKPGLPTYHESLEVIHEIFTKPYAKNTNNKPPVVATHPLSLPLGVGSMLLGVGGLDALDPPGG
jgi:transposase